MGLPPSTLGDLASWPFRPERGATRSCLITGAGCVSAARLDVFAQRGAARALRLPFPAPIRSALRGMARSRAPSRQPGDDPAVLLLVEGAHRLGAHVPLRARCEREPRHYLVVRPLGDDDGVVGRHVTPRRDSRATYARRGSWR